MMTPTETIQNLLLAAHAEQPYASGDKTSVYELPDMPEFLLRVPKESQQSFQARLLSTTALYPVHLCAHNFGQPILSNGDHIDIVRKVEGESLEHIYKSSYWASFNRSSDSIIAKHQAYQKTLSKLAELPVEAYEGLLDQLDYMTKHGIAADMHWENMLLNEKTHSLSIIDIHPLNQETRPSNRRQLVHYMNQITAVKDSLFPIKHKIASPQAKALEDEIEQKLNQAIKNAGITLSHEEIERNMPESHAYFAQALDIRPNLGTIAINDTPHAMRELIRRTEEYSQHYER